MRCVSAVQFTRYQTAAEITKKNETGEIAAINLDLKVVAIHADLRRPALDIANPTVRSVHKFQFTKDRRGFVRIET